MERSALPCPFPRWWCLLFRSCCCCLQRLPSAPPEGEEPLTTADTWEPCQNTASPEVFAEEGDLTMKLGSIPELDSMFSSIARAFEKQRENRWAMEKAAQRLKELSGCPLVADLMGDGDCEVQVHTEGYSFSLVVKEMPVPDQLQQVQQHMEELSSSTTRVLAAEAPLQQMTSLVLQNQMQFVERIKSENPEYLEHVRLQDNLRQNIQKVSLVKELSKENSEKAKSIDREMAQLAGLTL